MLSASLVHIVLALCTLAAGAKGTIAYEASVLLSLSRVAFAGSKYDSVSEIFAALAEAIPKAFPEYLSIGMALNARRLSKLACALASLLVTCKQL